MEMVIVMALALFISLAIAWSVQRPQQVRVPVLVRSEELRRLRQQR